jgi:hypothetical protein
VGEKENPPLIEVSLYEILRVVLMDELASLHFIDELIELL